MTSAPAAAVAAGARIGFVGLGRMGAPMAHRLVGTGYDLCGFDLDESPRSALDAVDGAASAARAADGAADAQAVVLMLPDSRAVRHVLFDGGLLDAPPPARS